MDHHIHHSSGMADWDIAQLIMALPFAILFAAYIYAVVSSNQCNNIKWPVYRTICLSSGVFLAILAVAGPLADLSHTDFSAHMLGHLFLGMSAPLLIALSAPMSLLLRTLSVHSARRLIRILSSRPLSLYTHPIVASILNIGGLWLLYTTGLFGLMHENIFLYILVHFHVFAAGYLFTISMIYTDPIPNRFSYLYRAIVMVFALAGHAILSKYIYAHPPAGVPAGHAELGAMIMYYGGDLIDIILIFLLCRQWYRAARPRTNLSFEN